MLDSTVDLILNPPPEIDADLVRLTAAGSITNLSDVRALLALGRLLKSPNIEVRRNAIRAVRNMGKPRTNLLKTALDGDQRVRWYSVTGLAMVRGDDSGMVSLEYFQQNEQKLLTYWRARASKM